MGAAIHVAFGQEIELNSLPISIDYAARWQSRLTATAGGRFADPADMHASLDSVPEART
jgi:hypothetical protein